ncbi:ArsR/SmtB family transcription factor [Mycolicibacterium pulveris]|uniref:ArsR/SmtB family transcription factor n=1 Tax=Mycolicibacterium pulveris TaxID=36813 RepID=UPI003CEE8642
MSASASAVLDALGDKTRRSILEKLATGPAAVGVLADQLPISRPAVSQHLRVLKDADLVVESIAGTRRIYRVNHDGLIALRDYLDRFWAQTLAGFKETVESTEGDQP